MRLFVAVPLSLQAEKSVAKLLKKLKEKHWWVRWQTPEQLHLTLAFLGEKDAFELEKIKKCLRSFKPSLAAFRVAFKGLGCFPNYFFPKVIWLGLKGDLKSLASLQKGLQNQLEKEGFKFEQKPFLPHLTLGRIKKECPLPQRQEIGRQLQSLRVLSFASEWFIQKLVLYQSRCLSQGAFYQKLFEFKLPNKLPLPAKEKKC